MPGTALSLFNDLNAAAPAAFLSSRQAVLNEAQKSTYLLSRILRGRDVREAFSAGPKIKIAMMFDEKSTAQFYQPNQPMDWLNPQVIDTAEINHRFMVDHKAWNAQELEYAAGMSTESMNRYILDLKRTKDMRVWTSILNKMDSALMAIAGGESANMETASGLKPYSLPALFSEDTTTYMPTNWSTIHTKSPTTESKWRNPVRTYDADDPDDSGGDGQGLERAFDNMQADLMFELPGTRDEYFEKPNLNRQLICTSLAGLNQYRDLLRNRNDRTYSRTGLGLPAVDWSGIDIIRIADLETNLLYDDETKTESTAVTDYDGPRYWWFNFNYVKLEFHPNRWFHMHAIREPEEQMDGYVQPISVWYNLFTTSRRRGGGIIKPVA